MCRKMRKLEAFIVGTAVAITSTPPGAAELIFIVGKNEGMPTPKHRSSTVFGSAAIVIVLILLCMSGSVMNLTVSASADKGKSIQGTETLSADHQDERPGFHSGDVQAPAQRDVR